MINSENTLTQSVVFEFIRTLQTQFLLLTFARASLLNEIFSRSGCFLELRSPRRESSRLDCGLQKNRKLHYNFTTVDRSMIFCDIVNDFGTLPAQSWFHCCDALWFVIMFDFYRQIVTEPYNAKYICLI